MARRKGGLFLPLDVGFMDDDKILEAGERAGWLYVAMLLFCKRKTSDGLISRAQIERLGIPGWQRRLADLTRPLGIQREPLVENADDGLYRICGWLNHNDPASMVVKRRQKDAERKRSSTRNPNGHGADSEQSRDVEQNRVEQNRESSSVDLESSPPLAQAPMRIEVLQRALETLYRKPYPLDAAQRTADLVLAGRADVADPVRYVLKAVESDLRRYAPPSVDIPQARAPERKPTEEEYAARAAAAAAAREALQAARTA